MREGWEEINFLESIEKVSNTTKIPKKKFLQNGKYPIISQEDNYINGYWNEEKDIFKVDKPIIIFGDHTKKIKYIDFDFVLGADGIKILLPNNNIDSRFFYYQIQSLKIRDLGYARHYRLLKEFSILVPPLPEQKQIVKTLDLAFGQIDQAKANLEQNLANAKELFASKLNEVFSQRGEGWEEKRLGDITTVKSGGTPSRSKKEYWDGKIAWYSSGELNNLYTNIPERYINSLAIDNSSAKLFPKGSLLVGMYDTAALKMSILDREATFNQAIAGVKPNENINLIFIMHSINSIKSYILNQRRGVRQKNLNLTKIKNIPIYLPSIVEQQIVVEKLNLIFEQIESLQTYYQQNLNNLEELKKSILEKAFKGEL